MFLKNSMKASKSIRAGTAISASCAVTIGVGCVLAKKTAVALNLPRNEAEKHFDDCV